MDYTAEFPFATCVLTPPPPGVPIPEVLEDAAIVVGVDGSGAEKCAGFFILPSFLPPQLFCSNKDQ